MSVEFGKEFSIAAAITDPAIKRQLLALEINGNNSVSSGFVSPNAHNLSGRRESEEAEASNIAMQFLAQIEQDVQERVDALNEQLNRLEEKSYEALMRTEEQLRAARAELQVLRDNAYKITFPDGSVRRVYRDRDVVRLEDGTKVDPSIVKANDMPDGATSFSAVVGNVEKVERLTNKRDRIVDIRDKLDDISERAGNNPSASDLDGLDDLVAGLPDAALNSDPQPTQKHVQSFNNVAELPSEPTNPETRPSPQVQDFGR